MPPTISQSMIYLRGLRFYAYHGVMEQESRVGGEYVVNVTAACRMQEAIDSDDLEGTVNYATLYGIVAEEMGKPSQLLEHVAGKIAKEALRRLPQIRQITVDVCKANPPMGAACDGAGVIVTMDADTGDIAG